MRIGLLSDTHGHMDDRILHHLEECDEIWHAGDIGSLTVTDALAEVAPLLAVHGNIDDQLIRREFPEHHHVEREGLSIWMTHIGGRPGRYASGIRRGLDQHRPGLFVCGHSHLLMVKKDPSWGGLYLNPGAAGKQGFHRVRTLLRFDIELGRILHPEVVELGAR
ncbi:MAG: metallophosphoesterase family protein [Flavobacteriales bacterium]